MREKNENNSRIGVILFKISFLVISSTLLFSLAGYTQPADSPWPMFHHDARHTGLSPYAGPPVPALNWSYRTGSSVYSSPTIGSDGWIYVGSYDYRLYALDSAGSLNWSYRTGYNNVRSSPAIGYTINNNMAMKCN